MSGFGVLLKKELREHLKTHRLLIVVAVFLFFGLGTPLMFHYLPSLMESAGDIQVIVPDFTDTDVVNEYFGTITQIGLLVVLLVAMGAVARERERGTAVMTLSKPVGYGAFIASKLSALIVVFGLGIICGAVACYIYTAILFGEPDASAFVIANLLIGLFFLLCIAVTLLCSTLFRSQLAAGGLALVILLVLWAFSLAGSLETYAPMGVIGWGQRVVAGLGGGAWGAVGISLGLVAACTVLAWQALLRREL
jgi:ABC-2 type transport system permease protein